MPYGSLLIKHYLSGEGFAMTPDGWLYPAFKSNTGEWKRLGTLALIISYSSFYSVCWNVKLLVTGSSSKLKVKTEAKVSSGAPLIPNNFLKSNEQKVQIINIQVSTLTSCNMSRC